MPQQQSDKTAGAISEQNGFSSGYTYYVLIVFLLCNAASFIDRQIINILLEPIRQEFGLNDTQLGFLTGVSFALFFAVMGIPFGWLADRTNRRNLMAVALTLFSGMTVLSGAAGNFWHLALARMGVGVGEAGLTPCVHSMTSDMFPAKQRATALSWYATGISVGSATGLLIGGIVAEWLDWRVAFFIAGVPGLLLAAIVRFSLREPKRGGADGYADATRAKPVSVPEAMKFLWSQRAFRHVALAGGLASAVGNGCIAFLPTYLARTFGMSLTEIGMTFALIMAIAGGVGTFSAGWIVDFFGRKDLRRGQYVVALIYLIGCPLLILVFLQQSGQLALIYFAAPAFIYTFFMAPSSAAVQSLAPVHMRASAASFMFLIFAVIGNGVGPQLAGILSDLYAPYFGVDSLRYALMTLSLGYIWASIHFLMATRTLREDVERAREASATAA